MQCGYCKEWRRGKEINKAVRRCKYRGAIRKSHSICDKFVPASYWWCEHDHCQVNEKICAAKRKRNGCSCKVGDFII